VIAEISWGMYCDITQLIVYYETLSKIQTFWHYFKLLGVKSNVFSKITMIVFSLGLRNTEVLRILARSDNIN